MTKVTTNFVVKIRPEGNYKKIKQQTI